MGPGRCLSVVHWMCVPGSTWVLIEAIGLVSVLLNVCL